MLDNISNMYQKYKEKMKESWYILVSKNRENIKIMDIQNKKIIKYSFPDFTLFCNIFYDDTCPRCNLRKQEKWFWKWKCWCCWKDYY